jgi:hypothetical protein
VVSTEPGVMLRHLGDGVSTRKLRLLLCGQARTEGRGSEDDRVWEAIEAAEAAADAHVGFAALARAAAAARTAVSKPERRAPRRCARSDRARFAYGPSGSAARLARFAADPALDRNLAEQAVWRLTLARRCVLSGLVRDVFGNPFRPVAFDPAWRTADTLGLARAIHEDRAFDRLPFLSDALMDAGCDEEQVIEHCRGDGPHVRGCWVVDLVLGRE